MRYALLFLLLLPLSLYAVPTNTVSPTPHFMVTDVIALPGPGWLTGAFAINDDGQIVGGNGHAFLWNRGKMSDLGSLPPEEAEDSTHSVAYDINSSSQIVGSSGSFGPIFMSGLQFARGILYENSRLRQMTQRNSSFEPYAINNKGQIVGLDEYRGFLYENGKVVDFGTLSKEPEGNRSTARSINNAGEVVGWSTAGKGGTLATHAFLWQRGKRISRMRDLGMLPGCLSSEAWAINDRKQIVGFSATQPYPDTMDAHRRACLWQNGTTRALGALAGGQDSQAFGLNNSGRIVGWSEINHPPQSQGNHHAVLWRSGIVYDLNALIPANSGWVLQEAHAINNKGQIVGNGTLNGQTHAFLLTPRS